MLSMAPGMISYVDEWLRRLPHFTTSRRDEKNNQMVIKAEQLGFEIPFDLIARCLFGDLINDQVRI
jgi:hypothetical protein